ncbi:ras-associated and pleckstrin homology domains-containing protein 1 isoform X1 [Drosophila tropicalis]|uniref:ras-associated and pleckstrin homology domains-containing protein 1 isoform X1 n=2 Tax=Drosophila tropicalis TaxID=46794 RepID=UPI0035ABF45C
MDCGGLAAQQQLLQQQQQLHLQQQRLLQQQQQQQQTTLNCLGETTTTTATNINLAGILIAGNGGASVGEGGAAVGEGVGGGVGVGIDCSNNGAGAVKLRKYSDRPLKTSQADTKSHTYRISMANLEDTQESELDQILGELTLLEAQIKYGEASFLPGVVTAGVPPSPGCNPNVAQPPPALSSGPGSASGSAASSRSHSRTNSSISGDVSTCSSSGISENGAVAGSIITSSSSNSTTNATTTGSGSLIMHPSGNAGTTIMTMGITMGVVSPREPRTESPDNDSAFSDTVSLLSSESSASSNTSSQQQQLQQQQAAAAAAAQKLRQVQHHHLQGQLVGGDGGSSSNCISKAAKIQLALQKLESASIRRLFVKAFTADGASKSLLVDERMVCGHVTRLLADKNHVLMQPNWSLVEQLGDLQMERLFEDHELLVDNLMTWNSDAGNRVLFQQRQDKVALFAKPEMYLPGPQMAPGCQHDEQTRHMLLEEFFESPHAQLQLDGPLYMKADPKKGWKRYHFVLRSSGLYYFPKEKTKNTRDLACLTLFNGHNVYTGLGWRKKWKSPTDYTFGFKSAVDSSLGKSCRSLKMLCAEDLATLDRWLTAIRICKYGKQLWHNYKLLLEDLCLGDGVSQSSFASSMRSESISSISSAVPSQCGSVSSAISSMSNSTSGRTSRASSSSSSGCLSDDNNGFDSEFTTGTIKRKPSMKPNLPLTTMTRQLKEVGEITICESSGGDLASSPERSGTLTRRHSRRKSQESNGSGTLKRRPAGSAGAVAAINSVVVGAVKRGDVVEGSNSSTSSSSNSTPTPTPSICAKPPPGLSDAELMCSSTLSLDSLPPPPPPPALVNDEQDVYGSQLSLASLPPPPPPEEVVMMAYTSTGQMPAAAASAAALPLPPDVHTMLPSTQQQQQQQQQPMMMSLPNSNGSLPPAVPAKPIKPAVKQQGVILKAAPPYKAPPDYVGPGGQLAPPPPPPPVQKKVSFADSPVLLRRKMCSPEPVLPQRNPSTSLSSNSSSSGQFQLYAPGPMLPPRTDLSRLSSNTRQSNGSSCCSSIEVTSPKRLQESASNPPRDFLKDLQRVMRKKWQVAQKCKLEPATTPHEVLGFRDFNNEDLLAAHNLNSGANSSHYYRETANVSHWVQEHYEYAHNALYENVHAQTNGNAVAGAPTAAAPTPMAPVASPPPHLGPILPQLIPTNEAAAALRKKRPPPPPPKRSDKTHLTNRV